jgi:hypothetical protein
MTSNNQIKIRHTEVCSFLRPLYDQQVIDVSHSSVVRKTYVFHESTKVNPSPSILPTQCRLRTMLRFLYVVLSKRSYDSSTDQGETASVERPFGVGHLQNNTVGLGNERAGKRNNKRFILLISPKVCATADSPSSFVNRSNLSRAACILSFLFPHNFSMNFSVTIH